MPRYNVFNPDLKELCEVYYKVGSAKATAKYFGVCKATILNHLRLNGIQRHTKKKVTDDIEAEIVKMAKEGKTVKQACEALKLSTSTVANYANRNGLKFVDEWHKGYITTWNGYIKIRKPDHPKADRKGYVAHHVLIAEEMLGRFLNAEEVVHHKDGCKTNNVPENLEVLHKREHARHHAVQGETGWALYHATRRKI